MAKARSRKQEGIPDSCSKIKGNCGFRGRGVFPSYQTLAGEDAPAPWHPRRPPTPPPHPPPSPDLAEVAVAWQLLVGWSPLVACGLWRASGVRDFAAVVWWGGAPAADCPPGTFEFFSLTGALRAPDNRFILPRYYGIMIIVSGYFSYVFVFFYLFDWILWLSLSFSCFLCCSFRFTASCSSSLPGLGWLRGWSRSLGSVFLLWVPFPAGFFGRVWAFWVWALCFCPSVGGLRPIGCSRRSGLAGGPALFPGLPGRSLSGAALLWRRLWVLGVCGFCSWLRAARSPLAARFCGSPCLGWCGLEALGFLLVVRGSRSPPGSVVSFLVFLYYARLFPPGICLIIPCYYGIIKEWKSIDYDLPMHSNQRIHRQYFDRRQTGLLPESEQRKRSSRLDGAQIPRRTIHDRDLAIIPERGAFPR